MRRLGTLIVAGLILALAATATGDTRGVSVEDNKFVPKNASAGKGDVIRFHWNGDNPHNVKFTKAPRGAKPATCKLKTSGSCRRKVRKAGVYRYVCTIHLESDNMRGRIVVD